MAQVLGKLATLAWTLFAARSLGPDGFGVLVLALSVAQIVSATAEWGFEAGFVRLASRRVADLPALLSAALVWESAASAASFGVTWLLAVRWHGGGHGFAAALAALLLAQYLEVVGDTLRAAASVRGDLRGTALALVVQRVLTAGLAIGALQAGGGPGALATAVLGGTAVGFAATATAARRCGVRLARPSWAELRRVEAVARTVGVAAIVLLVLFRLDALLVAGLLDDRAVAAYAAAYRLFEATLFVVFTVRIVVLPLMSAEREPGRVGALYEQGLATVAVVYLPFAAVCLVRAPEVLRLLFGPAYVATSTGALRWLALAPLAYGAAYLTQSALQGLDRAGGMLVAALVATAANVLADLALLRVLGVAAAAAATTAAYALQAAVGLAAMRRAGCRPAPVRSLRVPAAASAAALAALALPLPLPPAVALAAVLVLAVLLRWSGRDAARLVLVRHALRRA